MSALSYAHRLIACKHTLHHPKAASVTQLSLWSLRVTGTEAERLEEARPEREAFLQQLRTDIEQQARERGVVVHIPDGSPGAAAEPQRRS